MGATILSGTLKSSFGGLPYGMLAGNISLRIMTVTFCMHEDSTLVVNSSPVDPRFILPWKLCRSTSDD